LNLLRLHTPCVLLASALLVVAPMQSWATGDPSPAQLNEARERFGAARKLEEAGQFQQALTLFQDVARVKMTPQVRFHIALCLMHLGKSIEALTNFRTAIQEAGSSSPNVVVEARTHITTLEAQIASVTVQVRPDSPTPTVFLDDRSVPTGTPFDAEPGAHRLRFQLAGKTIEERSLNLPKGGRVEVEFTAPPASDQTTTSGGRVASFVAFGLAGAGAIGMGTFAFLRAERLATVEAACPSFTGCDPNLQPVVREGKTYASAVNVLAGVTAATAIAGVVLFIVSPGSSPQQRPHALDVRVVPAFARGAGFVVVEGRY
jgi:hypothetical protein